MSCKVFLQLFFYCSRGGGKSESRAPEFVCHTVYLSCIFLVVHYFWWLNFRCGANFRAPPSMSRAKTRPKTQNSLKKCEKNGNPKTNKLVLSSESWVICVIKHWQMPTPYSFYYFSSFFFFCTKPSFTWLFSLYSETKREAEKIMINMLESILGAFCRRVCHLMTFLLNAKWTSSAGGSVESEEVKMLGDPMELLMLHCYQRDFLLKFSRQGN